MKPVFLRIVIAVCIFGWIHAAISLADSGYPMPGANAQRNYKSNKPIRCADVSNGKTTVLDVIYAVPDVGASFLVMTNGREVTIDEQGWAYTIAAFNGQIRVYRYNTSDGSYNAEDYYYPNGDDPKLTHVSGGRFFWSGTSTTNIVSTSGAFVNSLNYNDPDGVNYGQQSSMAPYKDDWMVKTRQEIDFSGGEGVMFFKDSTSAVDFTQTNINADFIAVSPQEVIIYKSTTSTTEFPIVVGPASELGGPTRIQAPDYAVTFDNTNARRAMVVGEELIMTHFSSMSGAGGVFKFDAATGALQLNSTYTSWNGQSFFLYGGLVYHKNKTFVQISSNLKPSFVDLASGQTLATPKNWQAVDRNFAFSNIDETVLVLGVSKLSDYFEIIGYQWDTWKVNVRARVPDTNGDPTYGSIVIDDGCRVHFGINHRIYTLAPLPIQTVIPILECVDRNTLIGYFTYNNTQAKGFTIPQVEDRNNLFPSDIAPVEVFSAGYGRQFPFSYKVLLNNSNTHTWTLENYVLSFTIGSELYCPESINIVIILTGDGTFPVGFNEIVRQAFVNVTAISDSRVTLVAKKRSVQQDSTLETELEIGPDPSNTEPTPAEVVQQFQQQQIYEFNQQVQQQQGAPENLQTELAGKSPSTAVQGQIPPPPVAQPVTTATPTTVPSGPTSLASTVRHIAALSFIGSLLAM